VIWTWKTDPILLHLGPLQLHWYGLLFAAGLFTAYSLVRHLARRNGIAPERLEPIFFYVVLGVVLGARLVHCFFYEPGYYLEHPLEILFIWKGGLASHGGILGAILGLWYGARRQGIDFSWLLSRTALSALPTAFFIRLGNFFNSEILGRPTGGQWGITFLRIDPLPRHPVMLYEAFTYLLLFLLLWFTLERSRLPEPFRSYRLLGLILVGVFSARILLEFFKVPQADYATDLPLNVGQLLSLPFLILGILLILYSYRPFKESP
jgi:prolipoprotein diacylglyceryl transferase